MLLNSCVQVGDGKSFLLLLLLLVLCCIQPWISWSPHWSSQQSRLGVLNEQMHKHWGVPVTSSFLMRDDQARDNGYRANPWCCWLSVVYFIWLSVNQTVASNGKKRLLGPWLKWKGDSGALHIQRLLQPLIELMTCSDTLLSATSCAINSSSGSMADDLIHALSVSEPLSSPWCCPRLISCRVIDVK